MSDLTPKAKDIVAKEIIESTSQAFLAYVATLEDDFRAKYCKTLPEAYSSFMNDVWAQVVDDMHKEGERIRGL